ncbi:hypothetical protein [Bacillus atrophaeus]|uniref:hypothetical protein n=1 Tax=Bacillus atrophaeus TaxID=1452 RepID=UPI00227EAA8B|nr:hypothetical protein [Bacillus atrophaeus]MCY8858314.1 hypothetical protein [Bacillus atrophaeus]
MPKRFYVLAFCFLFSAADFGSLPVLLAADLFLVSTGAQTSLGSIKTKFNLPSTAKYSPPLKQQNKAFFLSVGAPFMVLFLRECGFGT